jgi:hypothetical protein
MIFASLFAIAISAFTLGLVVRPVKKEDGQRPLTDREIRMLMGPG